jgi:hypothetical protein
MAVYLSLFIKPGLDFLRRTGTRPLNSDPDVIAEGRTVRHPWPLHLSAA